MYELLNLLVRNLLSALYTSSDPICNIQLHKHNCIRLEYSRTAVDRILQWHTRQCPHISYSSYRFGSHSRLDRCKSIPSASVDMCASIRRFVCYNHRGCRIRLRPSRPDIERCCRTLGSGLCTCRIDPGSEFGLVGSGISALGSLFARLSCRRNRP